MQVTHNDELVSRLTIVRLGERLVMAKHVDITVEMPRCCMESRYALALARGLIMKEASRRYPDGLVINPYKIEIDHRLGTASARIVILVEEKDS